VLILELEGSLFRLRNSRYRRFYYYRFRNIDEFHRWRSCSWGWAGCHTHSWSTSDKLWFGRDYNPDKYEFSNYNK